MAGLLLSHCRRGAGEPRCHRRNRLFEAAALHRPLYRAGDRADGGGWKAHRLFHPRPRDARAREPVCSIPDRRQPLPRRGERPFALALLEGEPHWIGPLVNVYNAATARVLARRGAGNVCLPPELPASSINEIVSHTPGVDFEVLAFGRMPLAISARCAHARAKGHIKDNCQFVCKDDPDGLPVKTLDRQYFLALNGVQTVSFTCQALLSELSGLVGSGVSRFRLSPQDCDMVAVARLYNEVLHGRVDAEDGLARLRQIYPAAPLSNGFHHGQEGAAWIARARNVAHGANA